MDYDNIYIKNNNREVCEVNIVYSLYAVHSVYM